MINTSRCREKIEGWRGRRRTYICLACGDKFQVDTLESLPKGEKLCSHCQDNTYPYMFTDKETGIDKEIRASSAEFATLRAWNINPKLTFKIPQ